MKTVGSWVFAVGVFHNVVGLALGAEPLLDILASGMFASVRDDHPWRMAIFWFEAFGFLLMLLGASWHWVERQGVAPPRWLAVALLGLGAFGVFFMPVSGFWTLFLLAAHAWRRSAGAPRTR